MEIRRAWRRGQDAENDSRRQETARQRQERQNRQIQIDSQNEDRKKKREDIRIKKRREDIRIKKKRDHVIGEERDRCQTIEEWRGRKEQEKRGGGAGSVYLLARSLLASHHGSITVVDESRTSIRDFVQLCAAER